MNYKISPLPPSDLNTVFSMSAGGGDSEFISFIRNDKSEVQRFLLNLQIGFKRIFNVFLLKYSIRLFKYHILYLKFESCMQPLAPADPELADALYLISTQLYSHPLDLDVLTVPLAELLPI